MKTHHFKQIVNSDGTITLSGLPAFKEIEIVVMYPDPFDLQEEMKRWFAEVRKDHPFANMSEDEIIQELRKTREIVWEERHANQF
ncbi:MAG: hypothetical protein B6242_16225 [Anaerolineaceae bacterium 4572_78]|nr:MAG: hypothetical protein B6242_16225 [Anaerolineaceae bacterium 4572_78]